MRIGYIGLGNLGRHLAMNLVKAGFTLTVTDLDKNNASELLAAGAKWADSPKAVAEASDSIFTCLPSPKATQTVLFGPKGLIEGMHAGQTWIEMSTTDQDEIQAIASKLAERGVKTMECPVTGGVHRAAAGKITILVGGDQTLFEQHQKVLQAMGGEILHMGALGSAAVIKVITNMLAFIHLVADGEALMLAKRGGLDLAQAWRAIKASSGNSFVHETEGQLILNGSYDVAFTNDLALKDLGFAMGFGRKFGVPLELAGLTEQIFIRATQIYGRQAQSTQVVKLLEDALKTDLRAPGFPARLEPA